MDKWSDDQLKKMELGGNIKAKEFFEASPDYYQGMSIKEKYSSIFATQYKEKVSFIPFVLYCPPLNDVDCIHWTSLSGLSIYEPDQLLGNRTFLTIDVYAVRARFYHTIPHHTNKSSLPPNAHSQLYFFCVIFSIVGGTLRGSPLDPFLQRSRPCSHQTKLGHQQQIRISRQLPEPTTTATTKKHLQLQWIQQP